MNRAAAALIGLVALIAASPARAQDQDFDSWLVLVVDISGTISAQEYSIQRDGYVAVLLDPTIGQALDRTAISIVEFGSQAIVAVAWTDVRGAGAAYRQWERQSAGNTCVFCGLELALQLLDGKSGKRVIDISGDGPENTGKTTVQVHALRDMATAQGIQINTLALLVEEDQTATFGSYTGATGGSHGLEKWFQDLATGFAMAITTLDDLALALKRKLFAEIAAYEPNHPYMRQ